MRDRLIELLKSSAMVRDLYSMNEEKIFRETADHLLANGVIVPPCKVGDVVYWYNMGGRLTEAVVIDTLKAKTKHGFEYDIRFSDFGKTVFLTREEAERALKNATDNNVGDK